MQTRLVYDPGDLENEVNVTKFYLFIKFLPIMYLCQFVQKIEGRQEFIIVMTLVTLKTRSRSPKSNH